MSKKKQGGKTKQQKRPNPKFLGVKVTHGQDVTTGMILVRQRGTKIAAGSGVKVGRDHTLFAVTSGKVNFGQKLGKTTVSIAGK
jgi:large subunit ribosomal protein L27